MMSKINMIKSIYETGNLKASEEAAVVEKYNKDISYVDWYWVYKNSKKIAVAGSGATSSMIWGSQWDVTMKWFIKCGLTDYVTKSTVNGEIKGNYKDNAVTYKESANGDEKQTQNGIETVIPTGGSEQTKVKNIYDMAGNVWDWTIEANLDTNRIERGGNCYFSVSDSPASYMFSFYPTSGIGGGVGARSTLYISNTEG